MSLPTRLAQTDVAGRIGLAANEYGRTVTVMACSSCGLLFTVTGEHTNDEWGTGCLGETCDSYDVERDAGLTFDIEPFRIRREP